MFVKVDRVPRPAALREQVQPDDERDDEQRQEQERRGEAHVPPAQVRSIWTTARTLLDCGAGADRHGDVPAADDARRVDAADQPGVGRRLPVEADRV